ncbi:MAG: hypothetical protein AABW71_00340 [Nanoarchaeota archaeon]
MAKKYGYKCEYKFKEIKFNKEDISNKTSMANVEKRIADLNEQINNK